MTSATQTPQWSRVGRTHTDKQDRPPEMRAATCCVQSRPSRPHQAGA